MVELVYNPAHQNNMKLKYSGYRMALIEIDSCIIQYLIFIRLILNQ